MLSGKCPGQDTRYWTADDVHEQKCPNCGEMIEFFKTDIRLRCPKCKTRVTNSQFNMGCAQWCPYAEQCLGSAARGLKQQSFRNSLEEELAFILHQMPGKNDRVKETFDRAEELCRVEQADPLSVYGAIGYYFQKNAGLKVKRSEYSNFLKSKLRLPQQAVKDIEQIIDDLEENKIRGNAEKIVDELLKNNL
ncbi:MAG: hypothetical protein R6U08_04360 [Bacillota bacterium]